MTRRSLEQSNLLGYAAAGFEASLHNLLTRARLRRVSTHCTWEKTKVATSKPGSKVGRYGSSVRLPLRSCMVVVWGRKCQGRCLLGCLLCCFTFRQVPQIRKVVFCFGNRALGTHRHNSSRVDRDMSHALASPSLFRLSARAVVPKRARTRRFAARAGGHPAPIGFPHPPPTIHVMKISPPEPDHK